MAVPEDNVFRRPRLFRVLLALLALTAAVAALASVTVFLSGPLRLSLGPLVFSCSDYGRPLLVFLASAGAGLLAWWRLAGRRPLPERRILGGLGLAGLAWFVFFGSLGLWLHWNWWSNSLDMALHSQLLWNLSRGEFMVTSFLTHSFVSNHFWPGLYLLVPFYLLGGNEGMVLLQAAAAAAVFPAYLLARELTASRRWGVALALSCLLHPTLGSGALFDYHVEILIVPLILAALLNLRRRRFGWAALLVALSVSLYEVSAVPYAFLGLGLLTRRRWRSAGLLLFAACAGYLVLAAGWVIPHTRHPGYWPHADRFRKLGSTPLEAAAHFFQAPLAYLARNATPGRLAAAVRLLGAFAFLPLVGLELLLPVLPLLLALYLSQFPLQFDIRYGYLAVTLPFFFLAAARGAKRLGRLPGRAGALLRRYGFIPALAVAFWFSWRVQVEDSIRLHDFYPRPNREAIEEAARLVPPTASLATTLHLGPHFERRPVLLLAPDYYFGEIPVEYILLDLPDAAGNAKLVAGLPTVLNSGKWGVRYFRAGVLLLELEGKDAVPPARIEAYLSELRPDLCYD